MTILANVIFYNFLFFLGRGFLNLSDLILKRKNKSHKIIFGLPQSTFYVFFGLIFIGNISMLFRIGLAFKASRDGISSLHGAHQVAQKFSNIKLPL